MATKRPVPWFVTQTGRSFTFGAITVAGLGCAVARYAPNTFFLYKYQDFVQYYKNGEPVPLPARLEECYRKCLDILNTSDLHRKYLKPFSAFGYDLFHAGSTKSKFGAVVGIPVNFTYNSMEDLLQDDIQVNQKKVDWNSEYGQKLANALILPEKVQQFAICREILMTENHKFLLESTYPLVSVLTCYTFCQHMNQRLNLFARPIAVRGVMYSLMSLFGLGTYFLMKDVTEVHYETEVDKKLCELGEDFIESGTIFYDKLLQRNQALRELMGGEGRRKYSKLGNENFGLRQPRVALVHRKQFFEEKLKEVRGIPSESTTEKTAAT